MEKIAVANITDDYRTTIAVGKAYLQGHFLESNGNCRGQATRYELMRKKIGYFYKESVVYLLVNFQACGKKAGTYKLNKSHRNRMALDYLP